VIILIIMTMTMTIFYSRVINAIARLQTVQRCGGFQGQVLQRMAQLPYSAAPPPWRSSDEPPALNFPT
jgi:hypothetical protein